MIFLIQVYHINTKFTIVNIPKLYMAFLCNLTKMSDFPLKTHSAELF